MIIFKFALYIIQVRTINNKLNTYVDPLEREIIHPVEVKITNQTKTFCWTNTTRFRKYHLMDLMRVMKVEKLIVMVMNR